ncbi:MAG: hypothetical protein IJR89_05855 [Clostridia bacterium]|nr:hypothetical protein [Clostridia bacterium]
MKTRLVSLFLLLALLLPAACLSACRTQEPPEGTAPPETEAATEPDLITTGADDMNTPKAVLDGITPSDGKKIRIAFLGDSITEGTGTSSPKTESYPAQLAKLLGGDYVVGNFGKAGAYVLAADNPYNVKTDRPDLSYRNTQQYKDSLTFGADVVIILLGCNDIRSMSCEEAKRELKDGLVSLGREYAALPTVQKVCFATHIRTTNVTTILQLSDGRVQEIERAAAEECGFEVIDTFEMTKEYFNVMMHYNNDRVHPNKEQYGEMARAFYAALLGEPFTPTVPALSESGVVYLDGTAAAGDGSSPSSPVNTLAKAVGLLREDGGTVVVCGKTSFSYETHLPATKKPIAVTSVYGGVDYRETAGARLGFSKNLYLYGDYSFDGIEFCSEASSPILVCNYHNVTFGADIKNTLSQGVTTYPLLVAGYNLGLGGVPAEDVSLYGNCEITVNGGSWAYIRCGNRRYDDKFPIGTVDRDARLTVTVNGGTFCNSSGSYLTAASGMNSVEGISELVINGGIFKGPIYAAGKVSNALTGPAGTVSGRVSVTVTGGTFAGAFFAVQDKTVTVTGEVTITLPAALASKAKGAFTKIVTE